jgi:folylpolyglutamate synthase/dihydropteroate synthase
VAYACANASPRSLRAEQMAAACRDAGMAEVEEHPTVADALDAAAASAQANDMILVTGSLYTVADARPRYVTE